MQDILRSIIIKLNQSLFSGTYVRGYVHLLALGRAGIGNEYLGDRRCRWIDRTDIRRLSRATKSKEGSDCISEFRRKAFPRVCVTHLWARVRVTKPRENILAELCIQKADPRAIHHLHI